MGKQKVVYHGDIKKAFVNSFVLYEKSIELSDIKEITLRTDVLFYRNPFHVYICLEDGKLFPNKHEAYSHLMDYPNGDSCMSFIEPETFKSEVISKEKFKELKRKSKMF